MTNEEESRMTDRERMAQIAARLATVAPGLWHAVEGKEAVSHAVGGGADSRYAVRVREDGPDGWWIAATATHIAGDETGRAHAEFIANAPADVAWLLARSAPRHKPDCDLAPHLLGIADVRCTCGALNHAPK